MSSDSSDEVNTKLTHTRNLGHREFVEYIKSQPSLSHIIFNIQKYLASYQFYFQAVLTLNKGKDLQSLELGLKEQYDDLIAGKSFLHKINNAILSRSKCLDKIKIKLTKAEQILRSFKKVYYKDSVKDNVYAQYVQVQGFSPIQLNQTIDKSIETIKNIFIDMSRLRDMTIYIVEQIHQWKVKVQQYSDRCGQHVPVYFIFNERNFYDMIQNDVSCIWESELSSYILFKDKRDPMLIRNVVYLQQKENKQILQKYFIEMIYPQNDEILDKAIRCLQMMIFKYTPKTINVFEEEEQLIESYLNLEKKKNPISPEKQIENEIMKWEDAKHQGTQMKPKNKSDRGWIFGQKVQKRQRIKQIVERHQYQMKLGPYKPFNLANFTPKKSLPFESGIHKTDKILQTYKSKTFTIPLKKIRSSSMKKLSNRSSKNAVTVNTNNQDEINQAKNQSDSQNINNQGNSQMFRSLTKLNTIIYEDPNQSSHETPKMQQSEGYLKDSANFFTAPRLHSKKMVKINTFLDEEQKKVDKSGINVEEQQQSLNLKQFLDIFRADTKKNLSKPAQPSDKYYKDKSSRMRVYSIKQLIAKRKEQCKSVTSIKKYRIPKHNLPGQRLKKLKYSIVNRKPLEKSCSKNSIQNNSFNSYTKITVQELKQTRQNQPLMQQQTFISLKSKTIPQDMIGMYTRHIISLQPATSKSFTSYDPLHIEQILEDPFTQCFIFDLNDQKVGHIGQVIVSESLGNRRGLLRYKIQFINVKTFEFLISAISRVAQQLLSSTPCQQFLCPLFVDKMDAVSTHFIHLIDQGLKEKALKYSMFHILEKKKLSYKNTDFFERIYVFNSIKTKATQAALGIKMMGNYRSISFVGKGLLMSSNFKLRSKNLTKQTIDNYTNYSIGSLYIRILQMVMNKYHLKQIKTASMSINEGDEMVSMVKHSPFIKNLIFGLIMYLRNRQKIMEGQTISISKFNTMVELLNYLRYRQYDDFFQFDFLEESRFILNHQLILAQFTCDVSIQFMVNSSPEFLLLGNHRNLPINQIRSHQFEANCYLIPTTENHRKVMLMSAQQYESMTTDKLDLFSYLSLFFKNQHSNILMHDIPEVVFPNIAKKKNRKSQKIRCYQGLFRLFPEREFYSGSKLQVINHWQGYYPSAIVRMPDPNALVIEYPLIIGFYNCKTNQPEMCYLIKI